MDMKKVSRDKFYVYDYARTLNSFPRLSVNYKVSEMPTIEGDDGNFPSTIYKICYVRHYEIQQI